MTRELTILEPHGFCMGVKAAIETAFKILPSFNEDADSFAEGNVYCLHELVHNDCVVEDLKMRGLKFVDSLADIPYDEQGAVVLFSAHGVSPKVREEAAQRNLRTVDATCPFVDRVHRQVKKFAADGRIVVVIGHRNHVEVIGVAEEAEFAGAKVVVIGSSDEAQSLNFSPDSKIGVVCQTTLTSESVSGIIDALRLKFSNVMTTPASDVCTATRDRQNAVREFVRSGGDGVLVMGSAKSSNTKRLAEIAEKSGAKAWRVGSIAELESCDFSGVKKIGVTSGASTPESFFEIALMHIN